MTNHLRITSILLLTATSVTPGLLGAGCASGEDPDMQYEALDHAAESVRDGLTGESVWDEDAVDETEDVAAASWGSCYAVGLHYSFKHKYETNKITIFAYNGTSCSGGSISYGRAKRLALSDGDYIQLIATDTECDNKGVTTYSNGPSASSPHCDHSGSVLRRDGVIDNFWIRVANAENSRAQSAP